ncbi:hypothetical protein QWY84_11235 [Aquisalimonas lutea]|uniref:hypothetical protein n=1 Tax=Aquisalimonas lutea TaxID=1327750 RepID=UPI0025B423C6|nr:hypothetical protein [Aquisalimonas lutea]MDN3518185.1 hypothetical protein [Aquisalimonas lutea]
MTKPRPGPIRILTGRAAALLLVAAIAVPAPVLALTPALVRHQPPDSGEDRRDDYAIQLLELALSRTEDDFGPFNLLEIDLRMSQNRAIRELRDGRYIDVLWTMTNRAREEKLVPIRIPLARGLLGVRVPVIRAGGAGLLDGVSTLPDLRDMRAGQLQDWPDTMILRHNGVPVTTATNYQSLFAMLARGRFHYLPRGIQELAAETRIYERYGLEPYRDLLLVYRAPSYFFVAPGDHTLALRIRIGLERALADGSFTRLMERHPATAPALTTLRRGQARIIRLRNPNLPAATPLERDELWFAPVFGAHPEHGGEIR